MPDPCFAPRPQHLRTFLRDQPAGRASPTRAAAACGTPDGGAPTAPAHVICPAPDSPAPAPPDTVGAGGQGQYPKGPMDGS